MVARAQESDHLNGISGGFYGGRSGPAFGRNCALVPLDGTAVSYPSYDPVHRRLAYQRRWLDFNIIRGSLRAPAALPQTVVGSTHMDMAIDVSPDGGHIVFVSARTGNTAIWRADRNGANQILLAALPGEAVGSPRWNPVANQSSATAAVPVRARCTRSQARVVCH